MIRPSTVLLAALLSGPALWQGLVTHRLPMSTAAGRFLVGVGASIALGAAFRALTADYRRAVRRRAAQRAAGAGDE
jgi:purine-cytosine permease-like protein